MGQLVESAVHPKHGAPWLTSLPLTQECRPSSLKAGGGLSSSPRAAPKMKMFDFPTTGGLWCSTAAGPSQRKDTPWRHCSWFDVPPPPCLRTALHLPPWTIGQLWPLSHAPVLFHFQPPQALAEIASDATAILEVRRTIMSLMPRIMYPTPSFVDEDCYGPDMKEPNALVILKKVLWRRGLPDMLNCSKKKPHHVPRMGVLGDGVYR